MFKTEWQEAVSKVVNKVHTFKLLYSGGFKLYKHDIIQDN